MKNRHLLEVTGALWFHKNMPKLYLGKTILIATYLINWLTSRVMQNKSPPSILSQCFHKFDNLNLIHPRFLVVLHLSIFTSHLNKLDSKNVYSLVIRSINKGCKCYHQSPGNYTHQWMSHLLKTSTLTVIHFKRRQYQIKKK